MRARVLVTGLGVACAVLCRAPAAFAHGGNPAVAFLFTPPTCASTTAPENPYPIRWVDSDVAIATGTATVDLMYTTRMPVTFPQGTIPPDLTGEPIVTGVREANRDNVFWWSTENVPSGTYFVWSRVNEPAIEMSLQLISFAPGALTVIRPGDEPTPAVTVAKPDSPFRFSDEQYTIEWCARDPSGGARVKLEATAYRDGSNLFLIAEDLPASDRRYDWNTRCLFEGDYAIKATISDPNGKTHEAWSRYFLLVTHPFAPRDAGGLNTGCTAEAGPGDDAGTAEDAEVSEPDGGAIGDGGSEGCDCSSTSSASGATAAFLLAFGIVALRRRSL
jgi:MYXO-CTERM domain-containing protein